MAPKPGVIALRPLGVGEILDGAFSVMRTNPAATLGITFATAAVVETISTVMLIAADEASTGAAVIINMVVLFLSFLLEIFLAGMLSVVVSEATLGQKISVGEALRRVAPRLPGLIVLSLVVLLLTALGVVAVVVGLVYVWVVLALTTPVYVLEGGTFRHAMRRSFELVKNAWWRTFGILLLTLVIVLLLLFIFAIPTLIAIGVAPDTFSDTETGNFTTAGYIVQALGNLLATTISTPIAAGATVLIYIDRRIRREGLDVTLAEAARQRATRPTP